MNKQELRYLPISDIYLTNHRRWQNSTVNKTEFIGFDSETYKGKCKLICDSRNRYLYNPDFKDCLDFLFYNSNKNFYYSFWNLDFDISAILKLYDDMDKINDFIHGKIIDYDKYLLYYIRPKMLKISKGHNSVYIIDLFNMYHRSLDNASKEFLNDKKVDIIDSERLNTDLEYWLKNLKEIIKYCKKDSELVASLGNFLINKVKEAKLHLPQFFTSHASLSKQYFRNECRIPSIRYIPTNILDIAVQTYFGGRFEMLKRGYFKLLYNYDINSAYPNVIKDLPSLKYGKWIKVDKINKNETIGFYKCLFEIKQDFISPIPIRLKNHLVIYPSGIFGNWITWYEANLLQKSDSIEKIIYGYEYSPGEKEYYPFRDKILYLYEQKISNKNINEVFYWLFKLIMNALYGCFIERHKKIDGMVYSGILFNPIYATIITAKTRWMLLNSIPKRFYKHLVAFHTDSIISEKKLPLKCSDKLGDWSLDQKGEGIMLNTGVYQIGTKSRRRGFSRKKLDWFELLKANGNKDTIEIPHKRMLKIAESLKRFHNIDEVNTMIEGTKNLYINSDKKRLWKDNFLNCNDLLSRNISSKNLMFNYIRNDGLK